jgi:hypothetical protein
MSRTKHIAVKQMAVTAYYRQGDIDLQYVQTDENPADHFTKPLSPDKFAKHAMTIMGTENNKQYEASRPLDPSRHTRNGGTARHESTLSFIRIWENHVICSTTSP